MIFLRNDYSNGMHQKIIDALIMTNGEEQIGYGDDTHSKNACELIKNRIGKPDADVYLLVGGTQTNKIALSAFMRPIEAVISTSLGHIAVHETGAIEASGHKVIEMPSVDGKMTVDMIEKALTAHLPVHMVLPRVVYISNATEMGTIYTKSELTAISEFCKKHDLYLYIDGARLSTALVCDDNDLTIEEIASLCDAFYIGGTKNGAMMGEALVILNENLKKDIGFYIKQNGALLAKGRFLGIQFETLFKDDLFLELAKNTNEMAKLLIKGLEDLNYKFIAKPQTNLVFVALPNEIHEKLQNYCHYEVENAYDENHVEARFVTSWTTHDWDIKEFFDILATL